MTTENYPLVLSENNTDLAAILREMVRIRESDIGNFTNLPNIFMRGRKVSKVPTSSADVTTSDRLGDFNYTASYLYICVDDSGAKWRRVALSSW